MKTYMELTPKEQTAALERATTTLLEAICEGAIKFNDALNHDDLQRRIDTAWVYAERAGTPWFIGEFIMDTCRVDIEGMAQCDAEDTLYAEPGEHIVLGIARNYGRKA